MQPEMKRFARRFEPIADVISRAEIGQVEREALADAMADALEGVARDARVDGFNRDLFWLLAADPSVPCAGPRLDGSEPCPDGRVIRLHYHWKDNPDGTGRSAVWTAHRPTGVRCVTCGARVFSPGYEEAYQARGGAAA